MEVVPQSPLGVQVVQRGEAVPQEAWGPQGVGGEGEGPGGHRVGEGGVAGEGEGPGGHRVGEGGVEGEGGGPGGHRVGEGGLQECAGAGVVGAAVGAAAVGSPRLQEEGEGLEQGRLQATVGRKEAVLPPGAVVAAAVVQVGQRGERAVEGARAGEGCQLQGVGQEHRGDMPRAAAAAAAVVPERQVVAWDAGGWGSRRRSGLGEWCD